MKKLLYFLLAIAGVGAAISWHYISHMSQVAQAPCILTPFQSKALDLYLDNAKTLSSYVVLVLAGVGYFVQMVFSGSSKINIGSAGKILLILAVSLCAISLAAGYSVYSNVVTLVVNGLAFDPGMPRVHFFQQIQFWAFFSAVGLFGIFSVEALFSQ